MWLHYTRTGWNGDKENLIRQYLAALLRRIFDTLADFYDPSPSFRAYLDAITNAFKDFPLLQGCET